MRRYEFVKFAVLVISLFLVALSSSTQARIKKSRKLPKMVCTTKQNAFQRRRLTNEIISSNDISNLLDREGKKYKAENEINYESSYWLRNACHNGFVVIKENKRVLAQHQGLTQHDEEVELIKETCIDEDADFYDQIKTRLYSPSADRYICFNKKGKIRPMRRSRADRLGNLCAFYENIVPDVTMTLGGAQSDAALYVTLQSAYNKRWYLGFGPNPLRKIKKKKTKNSHFHRGVVYTRDGNKATLTRKMASSPKKNRNLPALVKTDRCDFRFHTGRYTPQNIEKEYKGLFDHISLQNIEYGTADDSTDHSSKITKTANQISEDVRNKSSSKVHSKSRKNVSKLRKSQSTRHYRKNKTSRKDIKSSVYERRSNPQSHETLSAQRFKSKMVSIDNEEALSNGVVKSSSASMENDERLQPPNGSGTTYKLLNNDINNLHTKQENYSQKSSNPIPANAFSMGNSSSVSSHGSNYTFHSSNTRNIKISKLNQSFTTPHPSDNDGGVASTLVDHVPISPEKSNTSEFKDSLLHSISNDNLVKENSNLPLPTKPQSMIRRQKLLRRINSLKRPKSVTNSKTYPFNYKKHSISASKSVKSRLRQRRLRLKYLRQHERPVNSYLYMHNKPRTLKRRIPRQKPTISPKTRTEVNEN